MNLFKPRLNLLLWLAVAGTGVVSIALYSTHCYNQFYSRLRSEVLASKINNALADFTSAYQRLPKSIDIKCNNALSWRTQLELNLMPTFNSEFRYNKCEDWNSSGNIRAANLTTFAFTQLPNRSDRIPHTRFVVVVGPSTAFPETHSVQLSEITDGRENTVLVVENSLKEIPWTEPRDLHMENRQIYSEKGILFNGPLASPGATLIFADFEYCEVLKEISTPMLVSFLTINEGEPVSRSELIERGFIRLHKR